MTDFFPATVWDAARSLAAAQEASLLEWARLNDLTVEELAERYVLEDWPVEIDQREEGQYVFTSRYRLVRKPAQ